MKQLVTLFIAGALSFYNIACATETNNNPFAAPTPVSLTTTARLTSFTGSINSNKVVLKWAVSENQLADRFEVEKSIDGKTFVMAALVFGTDQADTGNYEFFEKAKNLAVSYRIKLFNKDQQTTYSAVIEITPATGLSKNK